MIEYFAKPRNLIPGICINYPGFSGFFDLSLQLEDLAFLLRYMVTNWVSDWGEAIWESRYRQNGAENGQTKKFDSRNMSQLLRVFRGFRFEPSARRTRVPPALYGATKSCWIVFFHNRSPK